MSTQAKNTKVAVISQYSFPYGMAAANRIGAYCRGLVENGVTVDVIIPFQTDYRAAGAELPTSGCFNGINYHYSYKRYRSSNKFIRGVFSKLKIKYLVGFYTSFKLIKAIASEDKYDALIVSSDTFSILAFYNFVASKIGAKSIFIFDEYPIPIRHKLRDKIPYYKTIVYKKILRKYDAYISISKNLKDFYCVLSKKPTFILPIILDTHKFNIERDATDAGNYICYMGNMELSKDNVDLIIKAFSKIADEYKSLSLDMYGKPRPETKRYLEDLISTLGLEDRVYLKGYLHSSCVPKVLANAYMLVSSQPETRRAVGGFPTKLGEYLSTGVPALFTNVGENAIYVKDREHVFFTKPCDVDDYAEKLKFIINNYSYASLVAQQGKQYVLDNYSSEKQGERLSLFLLSLCVDKNV
ncbi:MAG: glycosyltransferase [Rikenellaceae bacterium]